MSQTLSDQRKSENEAVFREYNEKVQEGRDHMNKLAIEDNQIDLIDGADLKLQYVCECADENCVSRISLMSDTYNEVHQNRKWFVIANGHEALEVETVVDKRLDYTIVEKKVKTTEVNPKLHKTDVDNS